MVIVITRTTLDCAAPAIESGYDGWRCAGFVMRLAARCHSGGRGGGNREPGVIPASVLPAEFQRSWLVRSVVSFGGR